MDRGRAFPVLRFLAALRCCGRRSDRNAARTSTGPAGALLPSHSCYPPFVLTPALTIDAYAILFDGCICQRTVGVEFPMHVRHRPSNLRRPFMGSSPVLADQA